MKHAVVYAMLALCLPIPGWIVSRYGPFGWPACLIAPAGQLVHWRGLLAVATLYDVYMEDLEYDWRLLAERGVNLTCDVTATSLRSKLRRFKHCADVWMGASPEYVVRGVQHTTSIVWPTFDPSVFAFCVNAASNPHALIGAGEHAATAINDLVDEVITKYPAHPHI
jgi:hypothetical protein